MERPTQEHAVLAAARQLWRRGGWLLSFALAVAARELLASSEIMTEVVGAIMASTA